jgi:DNA-binding NarL/FixJ family response regulator
MKDDEIATGLRDAEQKGELNAKRETAINLLSKGMAPEDIAEVTGLSPSDIEALRQTPGS